MIDIIFQLVVFFMVTSTMSQLPGIEIELPKSETSHAVEIENVVISIGENDELFYQDESTDLEQIEERLLTIPSIERQKQAVVIRGDASSSLGTFVSVLDLLRKNGFENYSVPVTISESR